MKPSTLMKIALFTGIVAAIALLLAYFEDKNTKDGIGSLQRWLIEMIVFLVAAAITLVLLIIIFIKVRKQ